MAVAFEDLRKSVASSDGSGQEQILFAPNFYDPVIYTLVERSIPRGAPPTILIEVNFAPPVGIVVKLLPRVSGKIEGRVHWFPLLELVASIQKRAKPFSNSRI
jgi:hypothetical protein